MKDIVIIGAGGFGREVAWLIERINDVDPVWNIVGFVDDADLSGGVGGWDVVGDTSWLAGCEKPIAAAVAVGSSATRKRICEKLFSNSNVEFPNLIDPSAIVSNRVSFGRGSIVCAGAIFTVDISVSDFCIVNLDCTIGHDTVLNNYVTLYPSVNVSGGTVFGECSEMGTGSQVIQYRTIGEGVIVGAGAVVNKDLPPHCTAVGIPAKPIKFHDQ